MLCSETVERFSEYCDTSKRNDSETDMFQKILTVNLLVQQLLQIFFHFCFFLLPTPRIRTRFYGVKKFMLYETKPKPSTLVC